MFSLRFRLSLFVSVAVCGMAQADFFAPTTWARPTTTGTNATFQGWETFSSTTGPNAPQTVPGPAFGGVGTWSPINPGGVANAFDSNAPANGAFLTSGGNIYSPTGLVAPRAFIPNNIDLTAGTNNNGWTTLIIQLRTQGSFLDLESGRINGTVAPVSTVITYNQAAGGGFGGTIRDYWLQFQLPGNADSYQFDIQPLETSVSFDRLAIDTIWNPAAGSQSEAFLEPPPSSAVPEPAAWAMMGLTGLAAAGVGYLRNRRKRMADINI